MVVAVVVVLLLPLELLAARVTAQGGAGYSKLLQNAFWLTKYLLDSTTPNYSKLLQHAFWLTEYPVDSTTPTRHASAAAA